jgi:hypothetical protein
VFVDGIYQRTNSASLDLRARASVGKRGRTNKARFVVREMCPRKETTYFRFFSRVSETPANCSAKASKNGEGRWWSHDRFGIWDVLNVSDSFAITWRLVFWVIETCEPEDCFEAASRKSNEVSS